MSGARIVVGVDGSPPAVDALRWAVAEARMTGATVEVVHAWHYPALTYAPWLVAPPTFARDDLETEARAVVDKALSAAAAPELAGVERVVVEGGATRVLVEHSRGADLLVAGHRGRGGLVGLHLGSVALQCALHAECPVVVVRPTERSEAPPHEARVVVGVDGSEPSRRALLWAAGEARRRTATLEIVHCWHPRFALPLGPAFPATERAALEEAAQEVIAGALRAVDGCAPHAEPILADAPTVPTLVGASAGADLIVVGTRGHGGFPGLLLGSVSTQVLHHAHCPAVIVR